MAYKWQKPSLQHSQAIGRVKLDRRIIRTKDLNNVKTLSLSLPTFLWVQLHSSFLAQTFPICHEIWPLIVPKIYIFNFIHWREFNLMYIDSNAYEILTYTQPSSNWVRAFIDWVWDPSALARVRFHHWVPATFRQALTGASHSWSIIKGLLQGKSSYSFFP